MSVGLGESRSGRDPRSAAPWCVLFAAVLACASFGLATTVHAQTVHVRTTSEPSGVWLHARSSDAADWIDLCAAPCETDVVSGSDLGLSISGLHTQRAGPLALTDGAHLFLRYDDHHLTRTYGLIVTVIGIVGALTLGLGGTIAWLSAGGAGDMTGPVTAMASGAGVLALGLSIGIVLMNEGDHLEITVAP